MEKIGLYELSRTPENFLGSGSFSVVYLAKYMGHDTLQIKVGTSVAIKIISTTGLTDKAQQILTDELNIMKLIRREPHPNIVGCYDIIRGRGKHL